MQKHQEKYISKLLLGLVFVTTGIFLLVYVFKTTSLHEDWFLWGVGIAIVINAGLIFIGNAFVHKIKADLIRRQKVKDQFKNVATE